VAGLQVWQRDAKGSAAHIAYVALQQQQQQQQVGEL
jgi:hypothetical protein